MIEGTEMAKRKLSQNICQCIYVRRQGVAVWPAQAINYTNKTPVFVPLFKKGILDINDTGVNDYIKP